MKTQKSKEIKKAFSILEKHGIKCVSFEPLDFTDEPFHEMWLQHDIKPTKKDLKECVDFAHDILMNQSWELISFAIENVIEKKLDNKSK